MESEDNVGDIFDLNYMEYEGFSQTINELKKLNFHCLYLNIRSLRKNWNMFLSNFGVC